MGKILVRSQVNTGLLKHTLKNMLLNAVKSILRVSILDPCNRIALIRSRPKTHYNQSEMEIKLYAYRSIVN
jgi:hypothetical protein